ncbi:MAG: glycosyltransferase family 9 protein [Candidatus Margulisiibacteriota bacterium]
MHILIVKLGAIGDVLRTTSILEGLAQKYPGSSIDWLTLPSGREVLLKNRYIRQIFIWEDRQSLEKYDLVIGLEDEKEVCGLVSEVASGEIQGAYAKGGKIVYTPSAWFDMSAISKYGLVQANILKQKNRKTFQQHMADLLGIEVGHYVFGLTPDEVEYGRKIVKNWGLGTKEKIIGINTGAGKRWQLKALRVETTIDLVKMVKNKLGVASVILGGEDEEKRNAIIAKETGMPNGGIHSLRQFASIINRCGALVSSDSLAMHFGIALQKKLVVFFGPTSSAEIELYGLGEKICPAMDCLVCYKKSCDKKTNCMDEIKTQALFDTLKRVYNT